MNTFFISPLITLKLYLVIQKEKFNNNLNWTNEELIFLSNINKVFDYSKLLSEKDKNIIYNIVNKINELPNYENLNDKLIFTNQNSFKEITNYNYIFYNLLIERNYSQVINSILVDYLNISIGLSDIGPISDINTGKFNELNDIEKDLFINDIIENKNTKSKFISHEIMSKSIVCPKINTLTRIISNKSILYNMLENESFIPYSKSFLTNLDDFQIQSIIELYKNNSKSSYFVIKPSAGTLSDGLGIFEIDKLNLQFVKNWINDPNNNKYALTTGNESKYTSWILSDFIKSFLWKLSGPNNVSKIFPYLIKNNPELKFNFNDSIGRVTKFRFWVLWTIIDDEFTSYLYKDGYAEYALEELTNFSKTQLDPANIEEFYQQLLNMEEDNIKFEEIQEKKLKNIPLTEEEKKLEAVHIGTYLDFARIVNETNYPLGSDNWNNIVIPEMYNLVNTLCIKFGRYLNCLNSYRFDKNQSTGCFSYFALDIIIDDNNKPYLLEANSRPFIGFDDYFNQYDPNNEHNINVKQFLNTVLGLSTDIVNGGGIECDYSKFLVTYTKKLITRNKIYVPFTLGITDSVTSKVYNEIYNILDDNNYTSFPYARFLNKKLDTAIGFRGMSSISKYLISKISTLGNDKFLQIMRQLFPYDARMKLLNRIVTLGFYLGDKAIMTDLLKSKIPNWDSIIPYSESIDISKHSNSEIISMLSNTPLQQGKIIAKPAYGQQGKGIIISDNINNLVNEMRKNTNDKDYVISKYLDKPYLIKLNKKGVSGINYNDTTGRKCHLRAYVLVQRLNDKLKVYLYRESLIFCAAREYDSCINSIRSYCNLTNLYFGSKYYKNVLNKNPGDAYKDLSGLAKELIPKNLYNQMMDKIRYIIKTTILAVKDDLICLNYNQSCYQYIAFDLHLENNNGIPQPWLLEVNSTPGLKSPDYQWQEIGGLKNFLESILNITIGTKIEKSGKQLFEFLPFSKKLNINELPFNTLEYENNCMNYYYNDLKEILRRLNVKGRSYLTTKDKMCKTIKKVNN